ncbi:hypothetical protein Q8F55_001674 [Vanrija albida]|uniref:Uncharacterized protein n=1 Tax=Vanrija albida TaxID=181172 RepID=A0ABR3Q893_9TREE
MCARYRAAPLLLGLGMLAGGATAQDAVSYNISLTDMSPMISYKPPVLPNSATWNALPPPACYGLASCHTTSTKGAIVGVTFTGTGASFSVAGEGSVTLTVDGRPLSNSTVPGTTAGGAGPVPLGVGKLPYGAHTITLTLVDGSLSFYSAVLTTIVGSLGAQTKSNTLTALSNGAPNPALSLDAIASQWYPAGNSTDFCAGSAAGGACVHSGPRLTTNTAGATMSFTLPTNTSVVQLIGAVGNLIGGYVVTLTPPPVSGTQALTLNAWNPNFSTMQDNVLYFAAVDPATRYNLSVQYQGGGDLLSTWQLWGVTFVTVSGGIPKNDTGTDTPGGGGDGGAGGGGRNGGGSTRLSIAAIVGIVIGTLVALALIAFIIWFFRRRERKTRVLLQQFEVSNGNRVDMIELDEARGNEQAPAQSAALLPPATTAPRQQVYVTPYRPADALSSGSQTVAGGHRARRSSGGRTYKSDFRLSHYSDSSLGEEAGPPVGRTIEQERDGGRVVVPPSYDPSWADGVSEAGGAVSGATRRTPKNEKAQLLLN